MALEEDFKFIDEVGTDRNLFRLFYEDGTTADVRLNRMAQIEVNGTPLNADNLNELVKAIIELQKTKATIKVNGVIVTNIEFTSDPQTQLDKHTSDIKTINETIDGINDIQDLTLTREFISEEVANGAVVGSICEVERINGKSEVSKNLYNGVQSISWNIYYNKVTSIFDWNSLPRDVDLFFKRDYVLDSPEVSIYPSLVMRFEEAGEKYIRWDSSSGYILESSWGEIVEVTFYGVGNNLETSNGQGITFSNIIISETDIPYTPYYSGFKHLEFSKLESTGVNLFKNNINDFAQGGYNYSIGGQLSIYSNATRVVYTERIKVKPNTTLFAKIDSDYSMALITLDIDENVVQSFTWNATNMITANNVTSVVCVFKKNDESNITPSIINGLDIIISTQDTEYVPYEVLDTINYGNIELKEYDYIYGVKKYSQTNVVTFNGSENWTLYNDTNSGYSWFTIAKPNDCPSSNPNILNDGGLVKTSSGSVFVNSIYVGGSNINVIVDKQTLAEFKAYLSSNPLTIVYQTSTITETPLNIFPYLNIKQNGNLTFNSNLSVPNTIIYPLNTKSEVARLSKLVNQLDNEIVELKSENETLTNNLNATQSELDSINEYFKIVQKTGATTAPDMNSGYTGTIKIDIGKNKVFVNAVGDGKITISTSSYDKTTGIVTVNFGTIISSDYYYATANYREKDLNDLL